MRSKGTSASAASRMNGKYTINPVTNCWEWNRSRSGQGRYPSISLAGRRGTEYAYRVAWAEVNGPIPIEPPPDGSWRWELHHRCFNRRCVNPNHIQLVTHKQHVEIHRARRGIRQQCSVSGLLPSTEDQAEADRRHWAACRN
jgi:hypothetical protein